MNYLISIVFGYALGCLSPSYFFGKKSKGIDIRQYGSGNAGTTNTIRVLGVKLGVITLILDILKAVLALVLCGLVYGFDQKVLQLSCGLGVLLGHNFPFYLQFKGGKGVASTIGIIAMVDWRILLIAGIPALLLLTWKKYVSLASLTFMALSTILSIPFYFGQEKGWVVMLLFAVIAGLSFWRHRGNIKRLIHGEERKLGQKVITNN